MTPLRCGRTRSSRAPLAAPRRKLQTSRANPLSPGFSRLENGATRAELFRLSAALIQFVLQQHQDERIVRIVLDLDATEDPAHGQQELNFYNHHYRAHCYLPLLVYATFTRETTDGTRQELPEQELLAALLRPVSRDASFRSRAVLRRLLPLFRASWPEVEVIVRADSGFARPELYEWCEQERVGYCLGLAKNAVLIRKTEPWLQDARVAYAAPPEPDPGQIRPAVREFGEFLHQAGSWTQERLVTCKAEVMAFGENPRWLVTGLLPADLTEPAARYHFYCQRGDRENRIKEWKCGCPLGAPGGPHQLSPLCRQPVPVAAAHSSVFALASGAKTAGGDGVGAGPSGHLTAQAGESGGASAGEQPTDLRPVSQ
jgi:hypothetical protein